MRSARGRYWLVLPVAGGVDVVDVVVADAGGVVAGVAGVVDVVVAGGVVTDGGAGGIAGGTAGGGRIGDGGAGGSVISAIFLSAAAAAAESWPARAASLWSLVTLASAEAAFVAMSVARSFAPGSGCTTGGGGGGGFGGFGGCTCSMRAHAAVTAAALVMCEFCWRVTALCIAMPSVSSSTASSIPADWEGDWPVSNVTIWVTESVI
jgi:hypothetical protein